MDPQATWKDLLDAWTVGDWEEVQHLASALLGWLDKGGFPPDVESPRTLGDDFNEAIVRAACQFAHRYAASRLDNPRRIPADVPFRLTCCDCNKVGPVSEEEARHEGWRDIRYEPTSMSEHFLGRCPICQDADA